MRYLFHNLNQDAAFYWLANLITVVFQTFKMGRNRHKFTGKPEYVFEIAIRRGLRQPSSFLGALGELCDTLNAQQSLQPLTRGKRN